MSRTRQTYSALRAGLIGASILLSPVMSKAVQVTWAVDASASYVRLTVPDQGIPVTNTDGTVITVTVKLRDAGNNNQWTDAGGRRAAVAGRWLVISLLRRLMRRRYSWGGCMRPLSP